ncbi:alpha/beta hydrolase family protein [Neobacillus muris]|uniref:S9 family peptidase n=1 Tax=Neobacillus muris TaxID=2941334 RepID=UPI002040991C|nr:S9 family peptidase [Neobacillus muris]
MTTRKGIQSTDLYELKSAANPQFAPDGNSFIYVETTIDKETDDYQSHLFFQGLTGDEPAVQWTFGKGKNYSPSWSPDGTELAFISSRSGKNQLFCLSKFGGEARQLTNLPSGASHPVWSPDGKTIAFVTSLKLDQTLSNQEEADKKQDKPQPLEVSQMKYKSDSSGFWQGQYSQIAVIDINSGEVTQLTEGNVDYALYGWSPDGQNLLIGADLEEQSDLSFNQDIFLLEVNTKKLAPITNGTGYFEKASFSPNGQWIGIIGHEREYENATHPKIWVYQLETQELTCLTSNWDVPVGNLMVGDFQQGVTDPGLVWNHSSDGLYFLATDRGNTNLYFASVNGAIQPQTTGDQHVYGFTIDHSSNTAICAISQPAQIGDLYSVSLPDGQILRRLTEVNRDYLQAIELSTPETIEFESENGWKVQGWLIKPLGFEAGKKYPLILEIHGGPHMMYGNTFMNEFQILAAEGYAVLYMNPRGSHGYGQDFVDAVRGDYGGNDYQDLMNGMDYVLQHFDFIDESRLGVTGGSYGGFMTNWIVGQTNRFKAAVTQRSISNWISFYGVSDIGYYFTEWQIQSDFRDIQTLWKHSPLAYVENVETPLLILHSEKDYRCPIEQAEQYFIALKRLGKQTKFVRFPDQNHELSRSGKPVLRMNRLDYITGWFKEYID